MPIIVISARTEDKDKIEALDAGADDYLTKPFSVDELLARLRAITRRLPVLMNQTVTENSAFVNGALRIDYAAGCAYLDGEELHLTPIEYKLLCLLARNVGRVLTHTFIMQNVWGNSSADEITSLRVFMATLRKKINSSKAVSYTHLTPAVCIFRGQYDYDLSDGSSFGFLYSQPEALRALFGSAQCHFI